MAGDRRLTASEARAALDVASERGQTWLEGELAYWRWKAGDRADPPPSAAAPYALQVAGDWEAAAAVWNSLGCRYEAARALAEGDDQGALNRALAEFDRLGVRPAALAAARRLRELGAHGIPRGPRPSTRANPAHLTARELEVLPLLAAGRPNAEIAARLFLSPKTVDHHVGSILAKLGVHRRSDVAAAATRLGVPIAFDQGGVSDSPK